MTPGNLPRSTPAATARAPCPSGSSSRFTHQCHCSTSIHFSPSRSSCFLRCFLNVPAKQSLSLASLAKKERQESADWFCTHGCGPKFFVARRFEDTPPRCWSVRSFQQAFSSGLSPISFAQRRYSNGIPAGCRIRPISPLLFSGWVDLQILDPPPRLVRCC